MNIVVGATFGRINFMDTKYIYDVLYLVTYLQYVYELCSMVEGLLDIEVYSVLHPVC